MAVSESIRAELSAIFDARVQAECLYKALESVETREETNAMVYLFRCHVERWAAACDAFEKTIRQRALPLVEDFEGATR